MWYIALCETKTENWRAKINKIVIDEMEQTREETDIPLYN